MKKARIKRLNNGKNKNFCRRHSETKARWTVNNNFFCNKCYEKWLKKHIKKEQKRLRTRDRWRENERTCTERILKLRKKATPAELCFKKKMNQVCPVKFKFQRAFIKHGYYAIVDFWVSSRNICIEVDGGYHENPEQQAKDKYRDNWLIEKRGQIIRRITNKQAVDMSLGGVLELCTK